MSRAVWDALGYLGQNQGKPDLRPTENLCPSKAANGSQVKYPEASKMSVDVHN